MDRARREVRGLVENTGDHNGVPGGFSEADRHEIASGTWGCPSALKIHPLGLTPTFAFWRQPNWHEPLPQDGLKWAVYAGWSTGGNAPQDLWRVYDVPVMGPDGAPVVRLERPRISFAYDPAGLPAFAIGLDDSGVRYYENPPSTEVPVHYGSIALVRAVPDEPGAWTTQIVPFLGSMPHLRGLDFPSLVFTPTGEAVISAVGYHATRDDFGDGALPYQEGRAFAEMLLARETASGWVIQRVLHNMCSCGVNIIDIADGDISIDGLQAGGGNNGGAGRYIATSPLFTGSHPELCCPFSLNPYQRYIPAYPSLSVRLNGSRLRLAFSFGEQFTASSNFRNYLYAVDFNSVPAVFQDDAPLPIVRQAKLNSNNTSNPWDDYPYTSQSTTGGYVVSAAAHTGGLPLIKDEFQVRHNSMVNVWDFLSDANIPALPDYNRFDFRFWLGSTAQEALDGSGYSFLSPRVNNGVITELAHGTTLSLVSSTLNPGGCGELLCAQTVVEDDDQYLSFDASVAYGAFPEQLGRQDEAFVLLHSSLTDWPVVIKPQNGPLEIAAGYGDFDFDGEFTCDDNCIFFEAFNDTGWTLNPLADYNGDGAVDDLDFDAYTVIPGCCEE